LAFGVAFLACMTWDSLPRRGMATSFMERANPLRDLARAAGLRGSRWNR
jgi:hypothetical protein